MPKSNRPATVNSLACQRRLADDMHRDAVSHAQACHMLYGLEDERTQAALREVAETGRLVASLIHDER